MLIILFGLSGAGKNFTASILEKKFDYFWWDADEALTDEMRFNLKTKNLFTQEMRDELTQRIIDKVNSLIKAYPNIVITQGLYKDQNRQQIQRAFPESRLIWIKSDDDVIQKRLESRNSEVDADFAEKMKQNFEAPRSPTRFVNNVSDEASVINQLKKML